MAIEHTPGPWEVVGPDPMYGIAATMGRSVVLEYGGIDDIDNARLIAAAPELLEACQNIANLASGWDEDGALGPVSPLSWETVARMAMDYARAAIQKATNA